MRLFIKIIPVVLALGYFFTVSCTDDCKNCETPGNLLLQSVWVGNISVAKDRENIDCPTDMSILIKFQAPLDTSSVRKNIRLAKPDGTAVHFSIVYLDEKKTVSLYLPAELDENTTYSLSVSNQLRGAQQEVFEGYNVSFRTILKAMAIISVKIDSKTFFPNSKPRDIAVQPGIEFTFSHPVSADKLKQNISITCAGKPVNLTLSTTDKLNWSIKPTENLEDFSFNTIKISNLLVSDSGNKFNGYEESFYTGFNPAPKFPLISDSELLTLVQRQTFKYFWDFGHPVSGMARERNTSGETVTTGGTGFGLMAIVTAIERGFISRSEGLNRIGKMMDFLSNADRFHGAWPHWMNGTTGKVQPFSTKDNGGDLVETSFLVTGMLTVRQYLKPEIQAEKQLMDKINLLWKSVEWSWYTKSGENVLYWHWSPNYNWDMNHQIGGYNEALITYVLAASSPDFGVSPKVYHEGWAGNGSIKNGNLYYGIKLPLGYSYGGPLFFTHYSFLGLDPRKLSDIYASYMEQNVNHSKINYSYCAANPGNYIGYSPLCWGLTASDGDKGYSAFSPSNDKGVISPTAAISSIVYTPEESMKTIKFFYYTLGNKLWGEYGFYDAFNLTENWVADSFLAIDQGPQVVMIENYRSGLLWKLFMSSPEIQDGLKKLGFTY